ncbi:MAG TPA: hypothetical protein VIS10_02280, partial [Anaerolineales bacterium]
ESAQYSHTLAPPPFRLSGGRGMIYGKTGYWAAFPPSNSPFFRYIPRPPPLVTMACRSARQGAGLGVGGRVISPTTRSRN